MSDLGVLRTGQGDHQGNIASTWAAIPVLVALTIVATISLRYEGAWAENDTTVLTRAARAVLSEGTITPSRNAYDHGFAYPLLLASLADMTGLPIRTLQASILPWLTVATALMAFAAFRAVIGSARAGAIAASLLLVQPDFLFVNQRGSHERMTWLFVLTLLFALVMSLQARRIGQVAPYVGVFYLCGFALICTNAFFGSSFTTIILLAILGGIVAARRFFRVPASRRLLPRLSYVFLVLSALTYVVIFYLYSPAGTDLANLGRVVDRLAALYLNVDTKVETHISTSTNVTSNAAVSQTRSITSPYAAVSLGWTSTGVFFMLTLFTWLMVICSLLSWLALTVTFLRRGVNRAEIPLFLLWSFVAAAGVQIALSVATDFAGALGSNMQLRLFPVFTIFAIPMVVATLAQFRDRFPRRSKTLRWATLLVMLLLPMIVTVAYPLVTLVAMPGLLVAIYIVLAWRHSLFARRLAVAIGIGTFVYFATAAILKVTNDPFVSNKWTFYTESEARGIEWADQHLDRLFVWADFDERVTSASQLLLKDREADPKRALWTRSQATAVRYLFNSDIIAIRATRIRAIRPNTADDDRIYDNGQVQISHLVPQTPYQP